MKISTKLRVGFGIIVLLIVILGSIAWKQTSEMAQTTTDLYEHPLKVRRAVGELKSDILLMQRSIQDLCSEDADRADALLSEIETHKEDAVRQLDILEERYLGPQKEIEDSRLAFAKWISTINETIYLLREGKTKEADAISKSNGSSGKQVEIMMATIREIDNFARDKGDQFFKSTIDQKKSLQYQLLITILLILGLTIAIIVYLTKNIQQPLKSITDATHLFRSGRMEARANYSSDDEFGHLSASFNALAQTIETELKFTSQAAELNAVMLKELEERDFHVQVLEALIKLTDSQMGAFYLLNDDKTEYRHLESIGLDGKTSRSFSALNFEGEFGNALASRKIQYISNIPENTRFKMNAVSGDIYPSEIITIPIISGNEIPAVISLACIHSYEPLAKRLIQDNLSIITTWMNSMLANRQIKKMTQSLVFQNSELEVQKKELSAQAYELTEQNAELEMQKLQLNEMNKIKTNFLSNMSHELRTPLNSVIALSGVLSRRLSGKVEEEEYSYLEVIERNGKQLLRLINDILDLSRIEGGHEVADNCSININEVIKEVVDLIKPIADHKGISLQFTVNELLPDIWTDADKCRHILQNIIANAVKFTEEGSVDVSVNSNSDSILIVVEDSGIGIAAESLPFIFDEFRQADSSNTKKYGGTGLGLAIAKKYAEIMNGEIGVESTEGSGSKFVLRLPLTNSSFSSKTQNNNNLDTKSQPINPGTKTILLVEDTEAVIIQMREILESQGYSIMLARNGQEALGQIAQKVPDALVLDLMMPEVDGFEVLRTIREHEVTSKLPVIILTAKFVTKEELAFLKNNGIQQLIRKGDVNRDQLLAAVAKMFG